MKNQESKCRDSSVVSATFVNEQEAAKLTEMLAIAVEDMAHVSGGLAASTKCCCCHHPSAA